MFKKLDYMFAAEAIIHLFSDHRSLLFIYNAMSIEPTLGRYVVNKVQRCSLFLSKFPWEEYERQTYNTFFSLSKISYSPH